MTVSQIALFAATVTDLPSLKVLLDDALGTQGGFLQSQADEILERVRIRIAESDRAQAAGLRPTYRVMVATRDGVPIGFASMSSVENGIMGPPRAVLVDAVHVVANARKSGAGSALLKCCVEFADTTGAGEVTVVVSNSRDEKRFFARHGFGPVTSRRVGSVDALRRTWGLDGKPDPSTVALTDAERQRRRRLLLKPRGARRNARTTMV